MKIKVTSDSTCDLPASLLEKYDIDMVPLIVMKEEEEFLDNVTITPTDIFRHVAQGGSICTTAARSAAVYQELFSKYAGEYDGIIHITLGSGFSSSCQNALIAAQKFPNVRIVDSQNLCCGQGLLVLKACELAKTAASLSCTIRRINARMTKLVVALSFLRVGKHVVGLVYLLKLLRRLWVVRVKVGVIHFRHFTVGFFYLVVGSALLQAQYFIVISFLCHK